MKNHDINLNDEDDQYFLFEAENCKEIESRFERYHRENPDVWDYFVYFCWELRDAGHARFSAKAVFRRVRYEQWIKNAKLGPTVNVEFIPMYARKLMDEDPQHFAGFFETRPLKQDDARG